MRRHVRWAGWDGQGLDHCDVTLSADGLTLDGVVVGNREGAYGAHYRVQTDAAGRTRLVWVFYAGGPALKVRADDQGRWTDALTDRPIPELDGCHDVDIGVTPATNTLPIRRLGLGDRQAAEILAAYVPLPTQIDGAFLPRPAPQRYTCLGGERYRYEGLFRHFSTELAVDPDGLVIDYPGYFRRLPDPAGA